MTIEKQFANLSEFTGRDVELFRSSDERSTALYFTQIQRDNASASFELLRFGLEGGDHQLYIRYPNTTYFVELLGGGVGSGRGDMIQMKTKNIWLEKDKQDITIHSQGENLLLLIGSNESLREFNFMKKIDSYDKGNPYCHPYPNEKGVNPFALEQALKLTYLKLPDSVRTIAYCVKDFAENPTYFLVDYPAFNMRYDNHRFFRIVDGKATELKIVSFQRLKDGGTTIIRVIDELNIERQLYCPTPFKPDGKYLWDIYEVLQPASNAEINQLVELLKLDVHNIKSEN